MKRTLLLFITCASTVSLYAQTSAIVDANNINARVECALPVFSNSGAATGGFEVPAGSGKQTMYGTGLWFGGYDINGQLKLAGTFYAQNGNDFQPGPIMNPVYYATEVPLWNRVWKITKAEVDNHIANFSTPGYVVPTDFLTWPAHGDVSKGMAFNLAPYFDYNQDQAYDPYAGDYPLINGDVAVYYIMNDHKIHTETGGDPMDMEVHVMAYAVNCISDSALMNTVFVNFKLFHRGTQTIFNFKAGVFTDGDVGCYHDDYIGSDVARSMYYFYNGDSNDDCGAFGYDTIIPEQGIVFLSGLKRDDDLIDNGVYSNALDALTNHGTCYPNLGTGYNDGITDNEHYGMTNFMRFSNDNSTVGNPALAADFYKYMNSSFKDGTTLYFNGTGYFTDPAVSAAGNVSTTHMLSGNSDPLFLSTSGVIPSTGIPWTEFSSGFSSSDRRGIGASGPVTYQPGNEQNLDIAYVTAFKNVMDTGTHGVLTKYVDSLHSYFRQTQSPCGNFWHMFQHVTEEKAVVFDLYPNPAETSITIEMNQNDVCNYSLVDITGHTVATGSFRQRTTLDVNSLTSGIYFIRLTTTNQQISVQKFIKR